MDEVEINFHAEKKKPLITESAEFISSNNFNLTEEEIKKAQKELGETEEKRKRSFQELRSKLTKDEDGKYRTDDNNLLRYLRVRKFDCNKVYQNFKQAHSLKRTHSELFCIPSNLESLLNLNFLIYLPYTDENGNVLFYMDLEKWDHRETSFPEIMQVSAAVCDIISMNPKCQVNGVIGIWDMNWLNKHHAAALLSMGISNYCFFLQHFFPWRVTNILILNTSRLTRLIYKMMRPLLTRKIAERVVLLGSDLKELHHYVNPVLLPKKLGGTLEEDQCSVTQNILDNIRYLKYERSFA